MDEPVEILPTAAYSVKQLAGLLGLSRQSIYDEAHAGRLRSFTPNGCSKGMRILGQWVIDWMERGADAAREG